MIRSIANSPAQPAPQVNQPAFKGIAFKTPGGKPFVEVLDTFKKVCPDIQLKGANKRFANDNPNLFYVKGTGDDKFVFLGANEAVENVLLNKLSAAKEYAGCTFVKTAD